MKLTLSFTFLCFHFAITAQHTISIDSVSSYIGQSVTLCSKVFGTHVTKGEKPVTYLNLGADYPNQKLNLVIFHKERPNFPDNIEQYYALKKICVTGELKTYKTKLEMILLNIEQIKVF